MKAFKGITEERVVAQNAGKMHGTWSQQTLVSPTGLRNGIQVTSLLLAFVSSSTIEGCLCCFPHRSNPTYH